MEEQFEIPPLMVTITSYELMGDKWVATISHSFHGNDQETLFKLIEAHQHTDSYFRASFDGVFNYHGGVIYLRNSEAKVLYP